MTAGSFLSIAFGILFIGISVPLVRRRVPPNGVYGLRVPATFADEWVWYEANALSGRDMILVGVLLVIVGFALPFVPALSASAQPLVAVATMVVGITIAAIVGWRRANRLLDERRGRR
jgi:uncharacterized membrane protein